MLKRVLLLFAFLLLATPLLASTHTAASCSIVDISAEITEIGASTNQVLEIPAGTCHWAGQISWSTPVGTWIHCLNTIIIDDYAAGSKLWDITTSSSDTFANHFRMYGCNFQGGTGNADKFPQFILLSGGSPYAHLDHITATQQTYSDATNGWIMTVTGGTYGVIDNSTLTIRATGNAIGAIGSTSGDSDGNIPWAADSPAGTRFNIYGENNTFITDVSGGSPHGSGNDCSHGGTQVLRFNDMAGSADANTAFQTHPTGGSGQSARGCRWLELYGNVSAGNNSQPNDNNYFISSGAGTLWYNQSPSGSNKFVTWHAMSRNSLANGGGGTYNFLAPPDGFGYCGGTYQTGKVNATASTTVTLASGTNFNTSWPAGTMIQFGTIGGGTYAPYPIVSVGSTASLTLGTAVTLSNIDYTVGSYFNGSTLTGKPCGDQPGQGKGDRLIGDRPNTVNQDRGNAVSTNSSFNPRQALEPWYVVWNTWACGSGCFSTGFSAVHSAMEADVLVSDEAYYLPPGGGPGTINTSPTSPFDGSTGVGFGTFANRPVHCTTGTAYMVTNAAATLGTAAWYTGADSNLTGSPSLQKCTSTDTWTTIYTPYTYPHPLVTADEGGGCTPDHLAFTAQPSNALVAAVLGIVTVGVYDSGNNPCTGDTSTITIANKAATCSGMTLGGTKSGSASSGVFTTTNLTEDVSGACTLHATDGSLTAADSSAFTISDPIPAGAGGGGLGARLNVRLR